MGEFYFYRAERRKQPPKSGYGFLEAVVEAMLSAYVMQLAFREPYANGFLDRLGGNERFLDICRLPHARSEGAYSRFKKKLTNHVDLIQQIIADVFLECGDEIERLREAGIVPADKPPLGESLVMDSTDVEAWARPGRRSRKTGEEKLSKDPNAKWGHRRPPIMCALPSRVQGNAVRAEVPRKVPARETTPNQAERKATCGTKRLRLACSQMLIARRSSQQRNRASRLSCKRFQIYALQNLGRDGPLGVREYQG